MSDHPRQIRVVDVFTEKPLAGNQLAVVLDANGLSTDLMQRIAFEMHFSETTFILPPDDPMHAAKVRIFAPTVEMRFAGHPTVGSAWVLIEEGLVPNGAEEFVLEELVGPVGVRAVPKNGRVMIWLTNPPIRFGQVLVHKQVASALGIDEADIVHDVPAQIVSAGNPLVFVAVRDTRAVDAAESDRSRLAKLLRGKDAFGVYFFAVTGPDRLYGRMFSPAIAEDPASGSAAGPLGAFAVKYGLIKRAPRVSIVSEQGTKMGRQSFIHVEMTYGDSVDIPERTEAGGFVMPVLSGTLSHLPE
jgi:trans-2,3-dihydro-3-hydroxyanthranilate isomerase